MTIDGKLLEILCCPVSRKPLTRLEPARLDRVNAEISAGSARYVTGENIDQPLAEALITDDAKVIYPVSDGIPELLEEKGIGTTQFQDF